MINVALHIQNEVIREGLRRILEGHAGFFLSDGVEKIRKKTTSQVIITDELPVLGKSKPGKNEPRLILWQNSKEYPAEALIGRIIGLLDGGCSKEEVVLAVRRAAEGKKFVSSSYAEILAANIAKGKNVNSKKLSPREEEVLNKISAGHTLTSIAEEMNLSINTISTYQTRIIKKLGLKKSGDLIRYTTRKEFGYCP